MIKAIFYARFHPEKGPIIAHQVPPNSIVDTTPTASPLPPPQTASEVFDRLSPSLLPLSTLALEPSPTNTSIHSKTIPATRPLLDFPLLSPYLIPPQSLCNRLLTLRSPTTPHLIISHPICISDDTRYERNEFIFNFGIVISDGRGSRGLRPPGHTHDASGDNEAYGGTGDSSIQQGMLDAYRSIVRKVANVLRDLEVEKRWLTLDERADELRSERRAKGIAPLWEELEAASNVYALCEMVLEDLNCYGECMIPIDDSTTLSLRLRPIPPQASPVHSWHVPVLLISPTPLDPSTWDLTLQLLLPYIDGIRSVFQIAHLADASPSLAQIAIRQLVRLGCAVLLDLFSFGASYAATPDIGQVLIDDVEAQVEVARYVALPGRTVDRERVVRLLCSLKQGVALREWCIDKNESELSGVDVRRLVSFGVIRGILYRVHKYAICSKGSGHHASLPTTSQHDGNGIGYGKDRRKSTLESVIPGKELSEKLMEYLDGQHPFDQICTEMHMSEKEIMAELKGMDVQIIYR